MYVDTYIYTYVQNAKVGMSTQPSFKAVCVKH